LSNWAIRVHYILRHVLNLKTLFITSISSVFLYVLIGSGKVMWKLQFKRIVPREGRVPKVVNISDNLRQISKWRKWDNQGLRVNCSKYWDNAIFFTQFSTVLKKKTFSVSYASALLANVRFRNKIRKHQMNRGLKI